MSMIGGWVLESLPVDQVTAGYEGKARIYPRRLWLINSMQDECAIYVDPGGYPIRVNDYVYWFQGRTYWNTSRNTDDSREIRMIGFPFDPCSRRSLSKIV